MTEVLPLSRLSRVTTLGYLYYLQSLSKLVLTPHTLKQSPIELEKYEVQQNDPLKLEEQKYVYNIYDIHCPVQIQSSMLHPCILRR